MFGSKVIGETPAFDSKNVIGRIYEASLVELTGNMNKFYIKVKLKIHKIDGFKAYTIFVGHEYTRDRIYRLVQRRSERIDVIKDIKLKDGCTYNPCTKIACWGDGNIQLSKSESKLLEYFIKRANQTVTFDDIYVYIWEFEVPSKEAIKSLIKELRRKIGKECIKNIYGIGYIFEL